VVVDPCRPFERDETAFIAGEIELKIVDVRESLVPFRIRLDIDGSKILVTTPAIFRYEMASNEPPATTKHNQIFFLKHRKYTQQGNSTPETGGVAAPRPGMSGANASPTGRS